ncbi:MAG: L-threonylcarbamoyladenylate synthase [Flavobacteriaceae bacterium]|nr:L-threonylcarbamoyladenylate synthase [Flavobacteriaceae bacterium]
MAKFIKLYNDNPSEKELQNIAKALEDGALVIYPTDTVYGLGCAFDNKKGIDKVARLRNVKPDKANFSFICYDLSNLSDYVKQIDSSTFKILKSHLPGPYTFILESSNTLPQTFKKKKTVGIRIPDNNIVRKLVQILGKPIITTSIRDEDDVIEYTTDPELIYEKWQHEVDIVIDGGYGDNIPSTIIDLSTGVPEVVREGKGEVEFI